MNFYLQNSEKTDKARKAISENQIQNQPRKYLNSPEISADQDAEAFGVDDFSDDNADLTENNADYETSNLSPLAKRNVYRKNSDRADRNSQKKEKKWFYNNSRNNKHMKTMLSK